MEPNTGTLFGPPVGNAPAAVRRNRPRREPVEVRAAHLGKAIGRHRNKANRPGGFDTTRCYGQVAGDWVCIGASEWTIGLVRADSDAGRARLAEPDPVAQRILRRALGTFPKHAWATLETANLTILRQTLRVIPAEPWGRLKRAGTWQPCALVKQNPGVVVATHHLDDGELVLQANLLLDGLPETGPVTLRLGSAGLWVSDGHTRYLIATVVHTPRL